MIDNSVIQVEFMLDGTNDVHGLWGSYGGCLDNTDIGHNDTYWREIKH